MAANDPYGYVRLYRSMKFIATECREFGDDQLAEHVEQAMRFSSGSPTEFLDEAERALKLVAGSHVLPTPTKTFASALSAEIGEAFHRIGGA